MAVSADRFGEIAEDLNFATPAEVEDALRRQLTLREDWANSRLGEVLILMNVLDGLQVEQVLAEQQARRHSHAQPVRAFQFYGDYEIIEKLGEGAIGAVYLAREGISGRQVVLKMLRKDRALNKPLAERFALEGRMAGAMNHPNIVTCHSTGMAHGVRFLVMEFVPGETLEARIAASGMLRETDALRIAAQAATGLAHIHGKGIVHRDIKPGNILLGNDGGVKIGDFGSARPVHEPSDEGNLIVGTPNYMAPEQIRGRQIDHRADLYALGATLYHMLAGKAPFGGQDKVAIMKAHLERYPTTLCVMNAKVSAETALFVEKLMAKEPERRFASAQAAADEIAALLKRIEAPKRSVEPRPHIHRRKVVRKTAGWFGGLL